MVRFYALRRCARAGLGTRAYLSYHRGEPSMLTAPLRIDIPLRLSLSKHSICSCLNLDSRYSQCSRLAMDSINELFETALRDGSIHGASALAKSTSGEFPTFSSLQMEYFLIVFVIGHVDVCRSYGASKIDPVDGQKPPMTADTPMRIASATKLLTCIMAL